MLKLLIIRVGQEIWSELGEKIQAAWMVAVKRAVDFEITLNLESK